MKNPALPFETPRNISEISVFIRAPEISPKINFGIGSVNIHVKYDPRSTRAPDSIIGMPTALGKDVSAFKICSSESDNEKSDNETSAPNL